MFHRWAALVLVLALCAMSPKNAAGQTQSQQQPRGHSAGSLGKNSPNPFNPETYITFQVTPEACTDGSQQHLVTLRILNVLGQQVAFFQLQGPANTTTTSATGVVNGQLLSNVKLGCGSYRAYWNGNLPNGKEAPSGTYIVQLFIDGKLGAPPQRMYNAK
jgi:hypothetical protein